MGHSLGSIFSLSAIVKYPDIAEGKHAADLSFGDWNIMANITPGAVLTGAALPNATDPSHYFRDLSQTIQNAHLASTLNPPFDRDSGYIGLGDIYAHAEAFFHQPFDIPTIEYAQSIMQPSSLLEMLSSASVDFTAPSYNGSILVTTGQYDILACGGNCPPRFEYGVQNETFPAAKTVETYLHPGAGHGVNFANNATSFYAKIIDFIDRNVQKTA